MVTKTLIHLSDLHIGNSKKEDRNTKTIFNRIAKSYPMVPVLITGDLTDSATVGQYKSTRVLLKKLAKTNPTLLVPGNHDYALKGVILRTGSWQEWTKYLGTPFGWGNDYTPWMGPECEPIGIDGVGVWKDGPLVYFGVDSGDPEDEQVTARGWISPELAQGLAASLEIYRGKTRVVMVHHHPFEHGVFMKMKGATRFLVALRNNSELLLFGHKHKYGLWWQRDDIPLIVASHKSTNVRGNPMITGKRMAITVIEMKNVGQPNVTFSHRMDVIC